MRSSCGSTAYLPSAQVPPPQTKLWLWRASRRQQRDRSSSTTYNFQLFVHCFSFVRGADRVRQILYRLKGINFVYGTVKCGKHLARGGARAGPAGGRGLRAHRETEFRSYLLSFFHKSVSRVRSCLLISLEHSLSLSARCTACFHASLYSIH